MARGLALAVLASAVVTALAFAFWSSNDQGSAAGPIRKVVIPGIAVDSVPQVTSDREVVISVELVINEPDFNGQGTTVVNITAGGKGPLPGQFDPPVTIPMTLTISTHPSGICAWGPEVNGNLSLTYSQPQNAGLQLKMSFNPGAEWYYQVQCQGTTIRFPAGTVNESLGGWLGLIFLGTGIGGPGGATIDTPVVSENPPSCVKRKGVVTNTNQWGTATISVWVTQPPCLIPLDE